MTEPTFDDIEALVGPATPHFALLERLGYASSKAEDDEPEEPRARIGWDEMPSSAPASRPLRRGG